MRKIVLGLGGNVGDVKSNLNQVINALQEKFSYPITKSSFYKTKAWGNTNQPDFLNLVVYFDSELDLKSTFEITREVEREGGRIRNPNLKWGPRTIDIDILFYGNTVVSSLDLTIPHPQIQNRNFVLYPMAEILPNFVHPTLNKPIVELLKTSIDNLKVERNWSSQNHHITL